MFDWVVFLFSCFRAKEFEQSHDFQTFLGHLKKLRDGPADDGDVSSGTSSFSGQSGSKGLAIFCSSLEDFDLTSFTNVPNFGGAFLAIGQAEDSRVLHTAFFMLLYCLSEP